MNGLGGPTPSAPGAVAGRPSCVGIVWVPVSGSVRDTGPTPPFSRDRSPLREPSGPQRTKP